MQIHKYTFDNNLLLVNLGDVHRGDKACDVQAFLRVIDFVKQHDAARWVSTGDILNVALKGSKSNVYESMSLDAELAQIEKELRPIADKCLGFVASNHHNRLTAETGLNLDKIVARTLGVPYLGSLGVLNLSIRGASYYVVMHHGTGGGGKRGGKVNGLSALADLVPSADIYLEGHTHSFVNFVDDINYIDRKRSLLSKTKATFCTTGHFLAWDGSYAQTLKLKPMPVGAALVEVFATDCGRHAAKKVKCDLLT